MCVYVCMCIYIYYYITACIITEVMELFSTEFHTYIRTEFVGYKLLPQKIHTHTFRLIPVTNITPCCLYVLTPFLTTLTAGVITEVKKMGEHSHALMPPSESTRHKLLPSTIYLHRYIIACLIFHCLWYLVVYLCQPQHIDSHSYQNRICMLQTAPSVIYNAMFSLYLDPLPNYS